MQIPHSSEIFYQLINYEKNRSFLERIPYLSFLDLAVIFFYASESNGRSRVEYVSKKHLEDWNMSVERLRDLAARNTPRLFPLQFLPITDLIRDLCVGPELPACMEEESLSMYVITNQPRLFGATVLLYPDTLRSVGNYLEQDFYVLPSSIHECILVPVDQVENAQFLHALVQEVNRSEVPEDEILSDMVYYYSRDQNRIFCHNEEDA